MTKLMSLLLATPLTFFMTSYSTATIIREVLVPPSTPGNAYQGTFLITPSETTWAFGVGNEAIQDTSISGIASIDGVNANGHWISTLISKSTWQNGYDFNSIRPIGASAPSTFSIDTTNVPWQWGDNEYVAFYWLSEADAVPNGPLAVLQAGTEYDAFHFFTSGPNSPFAAFSEADGGKITSGETVVTIVPEPSTAALLISAVVIAARRFNRRQKCSQI